jgi:hypothetical protein
LPRQFERRRDRHGRRRTRWARQRSDSIAGAALLLLLVPFLLTGHIQEDA